MRIRTVKPAFFKDEDLADLPPLTRLLFQGLWLMADRDGRLENRPRLIKAEVLPYDDCDIDQMLEALAEKRFIVRYTINERACIFIPGFKTHQRISGKEADCSSELPPPPGEWEAAEQQRGSVGEAPEKHPGSQEGKGKGRERGTGKEKAAQAAAIPIPEDLKANESEIRDWLIFKAEKQQTYKGTKGLEALWRMIRAIPAGQRRAAVDNSMANNYAGLFVPKGGRDGKTGNSFRANGAGARVAGKDGVTL